MMEDVQLIDFWDMSPGERTDVLLRSIKETHSWHYGRNKAYQLAVSSRGVGPEIQDEDLPRLLRPTAQTFKSYIEILGTPFPNKQPRSFLSWLDDQLSIDLPEARLHDFQPRYRSLEAFLKDIEQVYSDFGFEVLTSSGTSGRSTIMVRDQDGIGKTVESFYLSFQRIFGMQADHRAIFIMPRVTRIAMARMAAFSVMRLGLSEDRIHFTIPFPAEPDQVRIRTGRTLSTGWRGILEGRVLHPMMNWMNDNFVTPRAVRQTIILLERAELSSEKVLVFGGWVQLHGIAMELENQGKQIRLEPGSLIGTGGGMKELYPYTPAQIRDALSKQIELSDGGAIPIRDVYGMAEGNWAAMQCDRGNYHIPPWVYAITLDDDNQFQRGLDCTGLLAFFDPFGGGRLFPAFFKSTDRVRLINGAGHEDPSMGCPCGESGGYLAQESIERVDLIDEAGCAAQI
jgi:hypothetical protein